MIKEKICNLLHSISSDKIKEFYDKFYFGSQVRFCYSQFEIAESLSAILEPGKPVVFVDDFVTSLSTALEKISSYEKSRIYVHNSGFHFTVSYLFQKQKKILYIDSLNPGRKPSLKSLENKGYTLYTSSTKIQPDGYSCGPIASEIARMLHFNYEAVEDHLSKENLNRNSVNLYELLPEEELNQLCESFSKKIAVRESKLKGADYRTAHLMCAFIPKMINAFTSIALEGPKLPEEVVKQDSQKANFQQEKQMAEEARSFFIGKPDNVKWFNQEINKILYPDKAADSGIKAPTFKQGKSKTIPFVLGIAGIILGVTIAVYLEMLAVGIAVGVCCLVAAAIVYLCGKPSSLFEENNVTASAANIDFPKSCRW
ncbi:TomO hydrophobic C-terminal domain-containing protein [Wolbachia endosymbiont of Rhagoletis cingulata]|uniref:TomO hydrophobic C-terminal domain-containing protein n=1 Tax=Wolbachia endosymbiont of Rhagoletis cingulata TaxID=1220542 RepID=UPI003AF367CC